MPFVKISFALYIQIIVHFAFILERDCIVHAVVQKTNLMYI